MNCPLCGGFAGLDDATLFPWRSRERYRCVKCGASVTVLAWRPRTTDEAKVDPAGTRS